MNHDLVLQVVVPMAAAAACLLFRSSRVAAGIAVAVGIYLFANAIALLDAVRAAGALTYALGGVPAPFGIEYRLDLLSAFVLVVVSAVTAVTTVWAALAAPRELGAARRELFFASWLSCVTGSMGIVVTADAFNVFVFLEVASLAGYSLVAYGRQRAALVASFRYLLAGTVGATFILVGIGLLYSMTGTLNLQDLAERLPAVADTRAVRAGWAFLGVGLCLKAAVFPLHLWLPGAYSTAPTAVTALLAGIATKIAIYLWLRFFVTTFASSMSFESMPIGGLLLVLGLGGALGGSVVAMFQVDPKRLLAWSSVAQIGYMVAGLGLGSALGLNATLTHLINHAALKVTAFLALGAVALHLGIEHRSMRFDDLSGLAKRMPGAALVLMLAGVGLIGMPLTAGFVGKWLLVEGLLDRGLWSAALVVLASSLLAAVYVWRLVEPIYFGAATEEHDRERDRARSSRVRRLGLGLPVWIGCAACVVLGIETGFSVDIARQAVDQLLGGPR